MSVKAWATLPKHLPIEDGNRVCYLLLHFGVPSRAEPALSKECLEGVASAKKAGQLIGVKIWPIHIVPSGRSGHFHYLFRFPWYKRDDKQALRIAESFLYAVSLMYGPLTSPYGPSPVFRIPAGLARGTERIAVDKLIQVEEARSHDDKTLHDPVMTFGRAIWIPSNYVDAAWKMTPVLCQDDALYRATRMLKASQDEFFVWPGQVSDVLSDPTLSARTGSEQTRLENALQNAFKAIEAVIGDPPQDDRKFFTKISSIGLDQNDPVGYKIKHPLHQVIRDMNEARDKKAAHGSTADRTITIGELMEYQACAHLVVSAAIENRLGEYIY